ncbi:hypothetical protein HYQ46_005540 [Verticillium longisporum]|nr:hypothetical protein HYQ46_005540 [Verticillium longisporum]
MEVLVKSARRALTVLAKVAHQDTALQEWLKQFQLRRCQTPTSICQLAYKFRQDEQIYNIEVLHDSSDGTSSPNAFKHLKWVAHFVGRLAARVRAVKQLTDDAARLECYLGNPWMLKRLYMEYYPILFAATDSHNKIPTNWSPAFLSHGVNDHKFIDQITQPEHDPFDQLDSDSTFLTELEDDAWPTELGNLGLYERFELLEYSCRGPISS